MPTTTIARALIFLVLFSSLLWSAPARAHLFNPYLIGMMAGPVSDGPAILLLKRRGDAFMSFDTLTIACVAGAASGVVAHELPAIAAVLSGFSAPFSAAAILGTSVFGCLIGSGGGAAAVATQAILDGGRTLSRMLFLPSPE